MKEEKNQSGPLVQFSFKKTDNYSPFSISLDKLILLIYFKMLGYELVIELYYLI